MRIASLLAATLLTLGVAIAPARAGTLTATIDGRTVKCGTFTGGQVAGNGTAALSGTNCSGPNGGPSTVTLSGVASPSAGGTVSFSPASPVAAGTTVTATIALNAGYSVKAWYGVICTRGGGMSTSCTFTANANTSLTVGVGTGPTYKIYASASGGSAAFTFNPSAASFPAGTNVVVSAATTDGSTILKWYGCDTSTGIGAKTGTCTVNNLQFDTYVYALLQPGPVGTSCGATPTNVTIVQTNAPAQNYTRKAFYPPGGQVVAFQLQPMTTTPAHAYTAEATRTTGSTYGNRTIIVSECPGSRTPAAAHDCVNSLTENGVLYFANATGAGFCNLASNQTYYVNVFPDNNKGTVACNSATTCGFYFLTR